MAEDRELLELAAKAAGLEFGVIHSAPRIRIDAGWTPWNPIESSGDALELAVKLKLYIKNNDKRASVLGNDWDAATEPHNGDPLAATRRAIVRAAAEIGRSMGNG